MSVGFVRNVSVRTNMSGVTRVFPGFNFSRDPFSELEAVRSSS
jgi:hypothetical protein